MKEAWYKEGLRFKCTGCGQCCTGTPGYVFLSPLDLNTLVAHSGLSEEAFKTRYTRSVEGNLALIDAQGSHDCVFLRDKKCAVYDARPVQCRTFPWWLHNLRTPAAWQAASQHCEGINHPDAPLVKEVEITTGYMTYLDNLIEQNFDFDYNR